MEHRNSEYFALNDQFPDSSTCKHEVNKNCLSAFLISRASRESRTSFMTEYDNSKSVAGLNKDFFALIRT